MSQTDVPAPLSVPTAAHESLIAHADAIGRMVNGVPGPAYMAGGYAQQLVFDVKPLVFSADVTEHARTAHASLAVFLRSLAADAAFTDSHGPVRLEGAALSRHHFMHGAFAALVGAIKASPVQDHHIAANEAQLMREVRALSNTLDTYFPLDAEEPAETAQQKSRPVVTLPALALAHRAAAAGPASLRIVPTADGYWRARAAAIAAAILLILLTPDKLTNGGQGVYTGTGTGFRLADVMPQITTGSVCPEDAAAPCAVTDTVPDTVVITKMPLPYEELFDFDPKLIKLTKPDEDTLSENFCCFAANAGCIRNLAMFREVVAATQVHVGEIKQGKMWLDRLNDQTLSEEGLATALKEVSHFFFYTAKTRNPDLALKAATLAAILVPDAPVFTMRAAKVMEHAGDMYLRQGHEAHALDYIERALDLLDQVPASADKRNLLKRLYSMAEMTNVLDAGTNEPDERAIVRGEYACGIRGLTP